MPQAKEIKIGQLVKYTLLFFIPLVIAIIVSRIIASATAVYLQVRPGILTIMYVNVFVILIALFFIPYLRRKESIAGVRYSMLALAIVGIGLTLPSALIGNFGLLMALPTLFAHYALLTFIYHPEVLGVASDIQRWFAQHRQFFIVFVFIGIVVLYVTGFGFLHYQAWQQSIVPDAYKFDNDVRPGVATFVYYSAITFATIGYGEIVPVSRAARILAVSEAFFGLAINVLFIAILLMYLSSVRAGRR